MTDLQLYTIIVAQLDAGILPRLQATWPTVATIDNARADQPTQQGRPDGIATRLRKVYDKRIGSRKVKEYWDSAANAGAGAMMRDTIQWMETSIQIDAYTAAVATPDLTETIPTAGDILRAAADALTDPDFIATAAQQKVGVQRITQADPNWIENDKDQFEDVPHFTVTLSHRTVYTVQINSMLYGPLQIYRV